MRPDDAEQVVLLQKITACGVGVEVGAPPHRVVREVFRVLLVAEVLQRVGPQQVAHGAERRGLLEAIELEETRLMVKEE